MAKAEHEHIPNYKVVTDQFFGKKFGDVTFPTRKTVHSFCMFFFVCLFTIEI